MGAITNWFSDNKVQTVTIFKQYDLVFKVYFGDIDQLGNSDNSGVTPTECATESPQCGPLYTGNIFTGAGVKIDVILDATPQTWVPSATYTSGGHDNPRMSKLVFKNQNTADPDRPYTFEFPLCEWIEIRMEQRIDNAGDYIETLSVRTNAVGNATESPEVLYTVANPTPLEIMLDDIWLGKGVTPTGKFKNFNFYSDECEVDKANYGGGGGCVPQTTTTLPPATAPTVNPPKQPNANYIPDPNWALAYLGKEFN